MALKENDMIDTDIEMTDKEKKAAYGRARYAANREAIAAQHAIYRAAHPEARAANSRTYRAANREKTATYNRTYYAAHPAARSEGARSTEVAASNRRPLWYSRPECIAFYQRARDLTAATGIPHEVDHIIPLFGELVSGLHVAGNLQVLTRAANRNKGNSFSPA